MQLHDSKLSVFLGWYRGGDYHGDAGVEAASDPREL